MLVFDEELPLVDAFDRPDDPGAFARTCREPRETLKEIWRVLSPAGRVVIVVPNRRGVWARFEHTPFGTGRPFSRSQLNELLRDANFTPVCLVRRAILPAVAAALHDAAAADAGTRRAGASGRSSPGVIIVEAQKRLYRGIPVVAARLAPRVRAGAHPAGRAGGEEAADNPPWGGSASDRAKRRSETGRAASGWSTSSTPPTELAFRSVFSATLPSGEGGCRAPAIPPCFWSRLGHLYGDRPMLSLLGVLLCLGCDARPVVAGMPVDVELVLAVDVSRSMDAEEFSLQRAGYVEAIRHPTSSPPCGPGSTAASPSPISNGRARCARNRWFPWQVIDRTGKRAGLRRPARDADLSAATRARRSPARSILAMGCSTTIR